MREIAIVTALHFLIAPMAHADERYLCRNGFFPKSAGGIRLAEVIAGPKEKLGLRRDWMNCEGSNCPYVVRGDKVLISVDQDGESCAWHFERFHEEVGWLPTEHLKISLVRTPAPQAWIGTWAPIQGGATIQIRRRNGVFESWGSTRWYGARVAMYGGERVVHFGSFNGQSLIDNDVMTLSDNACVVKMQLVTTDLVVTDNAACGGVNVSFGGVYKKLRK